MRKPTRSTPHSPAAAVAAADPVIAQMLNHPAVGPALESRFGNATVTLGDVLGTFLSDQ